MASPNSAGPQIAAANGPSITMPVTVNAGATLLIAFVGSNVGGFTAVDYDGQEMSVLSSILGLGGSIWFLEDPPIGTADLVIVQGGSGAIVVIACPFDAAVPLLLGSTQEHIASAAFSDSIADTVPGMLGIDMIVGLDNNSGATPAQGAGQTALGIFDEPENFDDLRVAASYKPAADISTAMAWTAKVSDWWHLYAALGSTDPPPPAVYNIEACDELAFEIAAKDSLIFDISPDDSTVFAMEVAEMPV